MLQLGLRGIQKHVAGIVVVDNVHPVLIVAADELDAQQSLRWMEIAKDEVDPGVGRCAYSCGSLTGRDVEAASSRSFMAML